MHPHKLKAHMHLHLKSGPKVVKAYHSCHLETFHKCLHKLISQCFCWSWIEMTFFSTSLTSCIQLFSTAQYWRRGVSPISSKWQRPLVVPQKICTPITRTSWVTKTRIWSQPILETSSFLPDIWLQVLKLHFNHWTTKLKLKLPNLIIGSPGRHFLTLYIFSSLKQIMHAYLAKYTGTHKQTSNYLA